MLLLPNNSAASEQYSASTAHNLADQLPKQREISSILTWVSAFATYTAIVAEAHHSQTKEMLAYLHLMVREASRNNNKGWMSYDNIFRKNAAANPSLSWANLDPPFISHFALGMNPLWLFVHFVMNWTTKQLTVHYLKLTSSYKDSLSSQFPHLSSTPKFP